VTAKAYNAIRGEAGAVGLLAGMTEPRIQQALRNNTLTRTINDRARRSANDAVRRSQSILRSEQREVAALTREVLSDFRAHAAGRWSDIATPGQKLEWLLFSNDLSSEAIRGLAKGVIDGLTDDELRALDYGTVVALAGVLSYVSDPISEAHLVKPLRAYGLASPVTPERREFAEPNRSQFTRLREHTAFVWTQRDGAFHAVESRTFDATIVGGGRERAQR
jgi:hypothetical protein